MPTKPPHKQGNAPASASLAALFGDQGVQTGEASLEKLFRQKGVILYEQVQFARLVGRHLTKQTADQGAQTGTPLNDLFGDKVYPVPPGVRGNY